MRILKKENPNYKPYRHIAINRDKFEAVPRKAPVQVGIDNASILETVKESFPDIKLFEKEDITSEQVRELGTDYTLDFHVSKENYTALINFLKHNSRLKMDYLIMVTAVDWLDHIDVLVTLMSTEHGHKVFVRCSLQDRADPRIDSLAIIYKGANFHERETYDFFGVRFEGHPDLRRIFTPEDIVGYPLRKDWEDPTRVIKRPY